jgi:hypothetical protein
VAIDLLVDPAPAHTERECKLRRTEQGLPERCSIGNGTHGPRKERSIYAYIDEIEEERLG